MDDPQELDAAGKQLTPVRNELNNLLVARQIIRANESALLMRDRMARSLGMQFDSRRNVYQAAGYPESDPDYLVYEGKFLREGVGTRVVEAPAVATWRLPPTVTDQDDNQEPSDFVRTWAELTSIETVGDVVDDQLPLWSYLAQADIQAGIGRYGGLLVGVDDGKPLYEPLERGAGRELLYLTPLNEDRLTIKEFGRDNQNPRYGLPLSYDVRLLENTTTEQVHWTRVIHIAEGALVYGRPRMERVFNYLEDLLKITAGSGEAAWKLMWKGIIMSTKEGYQMPSDTTDLVDKAYEWINDLTRVLEADGVDVQVQGGEIVDPSPNIRILIALVSAATSIPQRLLLGSERGELASGQDEVNWNNHIAYRREHFAEPVILRRLINRLIYAGVLPMPRDSRYTVRWPNLFAQSQLEVAELNLKRAQTLATIAPGAADMLLDEDEARILAGFNPRDASRNLGVEDEDTAA